MVEIDVAFDWTMLYIYIALSLCLFQMHKKILDKGKPDDAMPGDKTKKVFQCS